MSPARVLILVGGLFVAAGLLWLVAEKLGLGRLPGDFLIRGKGFSLYFPLMTSIVLSVVLTVVLNLFRK